jgi:hypothetical protein
MVERVKPLLLILLGLSVLVGCRFSVDWSSIPCGSTAHCPLGYVCAQGLCQESLSADDDDSGQSDDDDDSGQA